jgi:hypothetical protein
MGRARELLALILRQRWSMENHNVRPWRSRYRWLGNLALTSRNPKKGNRVKRLLEASKHFPLTDGGVGHYNTPSFVLVAQWIEWKPPELQAAGSNPAENDKRGRLEKKPSQAKREENHRAEASHQQQN